MLLHEIEDAALQLLLNVSGPLVTGTAVITDGAGNPISGPLPPHVIVAGETWALHLYKGDGRDDIQTPAIIVSCELGDEDYDSGNQFIDLVTQVHVVVDPLASELPDPISTARSISEAVVNVMQLDTLPNELNAVGSEKMTVLGVRERSQAKRQDERATIHETTVSLYASNVDVR
jgi:hypothetical protein